jgi:hypothetical protein
LEATIDVLSAALLLAAAISGAAALCRHERLGDVKFNGWDEAALFAGGGTFLHALLGLLAEV